MANGANRAAAFRFTEIQSHLRQTPENIADAAETQQAEEQDGVSLPCTTECLPDPENTTIIPPDYAPIDKCQVQVGDKKEWRKCVPIVRLDTLRDKLAERKQAQGIQLTEQITKMEEVINKIKAIEERFISHKEERNRYSTEVAKTFKEKSEFMKMHEILKSSVGTLEDWKRAVGVLESKYTMLVEEDLPPNPPGNCEGLPCYEKDGEGDGLTCQYFDNQLFQGAPVEFQQKQIKFFWANEAPAEGINPNNFSIECSGLIKPPITDSYAFHCEADDGCIIEMNGEVILRDNIPEEKDDQKDFLQEKKATFEKALQGDKYDSFIIPKKSTDEPRYPRITKTEELPLDGGVPVPIKIKMFHSIHNSLFEDGNSQFYFYWESSQIRKQIVPTQNMQTKIKVNTLKPTNYNAQELALGNFLNDEDAFMDKSIWKYKYIPPLMQGGYVLKPKAESQLKIVEFSVGTAIRVQFGFQNDIENPLDSKWKATDMEMAALKIETIDEWKLRGGNEVIAKDDIGMKIFQQDWPRGGDVKFELALTKPAKWFVVVSPGVKPPLETCGGEEIELTSEEAETYDSCTETSAESGQNCKKALSADTAEQWMASGNVDENVTVKFKDRVKPQIIWIAQPQEPTNMASLIRVKIPPEIEFEFDSDKGLRAIFFDDPEYNWQKFPFPKTVPTKQIEVSVVNILGGMNASLKFKIFGTKCIMPEEQAKKEDSETKQHLGLRKFIPKVQVFKCSDDLSRMFADVAWINCIEPCEFKSEMLGIDVVELTPGAFTLDTKPCIAARYMFPDDVKTVDWGIKRELNFIEVNGKFPPYAYRFEPNVIKREVNLKVNSEADILDNELCYIRAKITALTDSSVTVDQEGKEKTVLIENAHLCGDKLPFTPCQTPQTNPVKIKFASPIDKPILIASNIGPQLQDMGLIASQHSKYQQGWNKPVQTVGLDTLPELTDNREKILGTAAVLNDEKDQWFIVVPNGTQDVKILIKLVNTRQNRNKFKENKNIIELKINDKEHKPQPMGMDDEITIDQPNLGVKHREIRIIWVKGTINMSEVEIIPINPDVPKGGPKTEIGRNTWEGAVCFEDPLNCAFSDAEVKDITNCPGKFVKIKGSAENKKIACMNKCIENKFKTEELCNLYCPETLKCKPDKEFFDCGVELPPKEEEEAPPADA